MTYITLTNGARIRVSPEDHARLSAHSWSQFKNGRAYRKELIPREERIGKKMYRTILMHREIMGVDDPRKVIFRDGDATNCTRANLVIKGPRFRPRQRVKKGGSSPYRGVGWNRAKEMWQAFIRVDGKLKHLGFFQPGPDGEQLAAQAYDDIAKRLFGDLAVLNFPRVRRRRPGSAGAEGMPEEQQAEHPAAGAPEPQARPSASTGGEMEELFEKPVHELTPEELEIMKARFLGERYRGNVRRAG